MTIFLSLLIGYLLGSISPAFILGKILKGIDIREHGTKNAGTTNVKRTLGIGPATITAIYDLGKGLLAMWIASLLGASPIIIYAAGFAAVFGHIFPFYLKFRGGQGSATALAILFYNLSILLRQNLMPISDILALAVLVLGILYITQQGEMIGFVALPGFAYFMFKNYPVNIITITSAIVLALLFTNVVREIIRQKLYTLKPAFHKKVKLWRLVSRPLAIVFPLLLYYTDKKVTLLVLGPILLISIIADLIRLLNKKANLFFLITKPGIYKEKEARRFSSITLFLMASFLIILIFPTPIAVLATVFLIFGDMFSKFFGIQYGRTNFFGKTLEGSVAYFVVCFCAGFFLLDYFPNLSLFMILAGSIVAAIIEVLPLGVDDNLSTGVISAAAMFFIQQIS
ncbi:MAG TPA: glycerol-3-phosphate acyltransferase [Patescibacteria group bacterium]|nr:glycerol-3-phosphate acyltransferase [Patescibacteria group bacterium]